jgi:hypothetical protein
VNDHETAAGDLVWQPFVDALCGAASAWDADLGRLAGGDEQHVPVSQAQAENVMLALAALAHRMAKATASIVRASADAGLANLSGEDDLPDQVESLGRMALCAEAMHNAAEAARAVVGHGEHV